MEATVLKWHKQPGELVKLDETLLDIATDKVDSEVPSSVAGVVTELLYKVNDVVPVGAVIARIDAGGAAQAVAAPAAVQQVAKPQTAAPQYQAAPVVAEHNGARFYSPLVLNIAGKEGISMAELEKIPGTGNEGRVTKKDILTYVAERSTAPAVQQPMQQPFAAPVQPVAPAAAVNQPAAPQPQVQFTGNVEIIEMDRMRKLIADHMVRSKATSPHVTSFTEADVTNIVKWRERIPVRRLLSKI